MTHLDQRPATATAALDKLLAGNRRFVAGTPLHPNQDAERRVALKAEQRPFAVVFGCSDSRLAAEIIFDRGLGDLFVVRTAGHVVGPEVCASVEYGVTVLGASLVVVLGHASCGAVAATHAALNSTPAARARTGATPAVDAASAGANAASAGVDAAVDVASVAVDVASGGAVDSCDAGLRSIIDRVAVSARHAAAEGIGDPDGIAAVHVRRTVEHLSGPSTGGLASAVAAGRCLVVGAFYHLADGQVTVL